MEIAIVIAVAFGASMLTFFSGFGLGTMLTPAFVLFFPPEIAVAATAIVHFANNLFKLTLIGKHAVKKIVLGFGLPAIVGAFGGAYFLGWLSNLNQELHVFGLTTTLLNLCIGGLILLFALVELIPGIRKMGLAPSWLIAGGVISGFFGGLSGHQGALRSAFLIKFPLSKEQFVASGIVIACLIDTMRIGTYAFTFDFDSIIAQSGLMMMATVAAFAGAVVGKRLMKKITIDAIQWIVGGLMAIVGLLLAIGLI